jgi:hypothetical protein
MTRYLKRLLIPACLTLSTIGMAAQLFSQINRYAVNVLFSDQWVTYTPLFDNYSWWQTFSMQFGPPRLGLGMFVTELVANLSGWDARAEAFVVGFILVLITACALWLKWRLFRSLTVWDSLIPMICLSLPQIPAHTIVPFPAYSAVPTLLLMFYALSLTCGNVVLRCSLLSALNFLLVFSCWGIFAGVFTPLLLGYLYLRGEKWTLFPLAASALTFGLFFSGYTFAPAVACFHFPHYPLIDYFWFVAHLFSYSTGLPCGTHRYFVTKGFGALLVSGVVFVLASGLRRLHRAKEYAPRDLVIVFFIGFSLLFAVNAALGRVCVGVCAANAERYQTLLTPVWLGLYFAAPAGRFRHAAGLLILALCFLMPESQPSHYEGAMKRYAEVKRTWVACYLESGNAVECDARVGMSSSTPTPAIAVQGRLEYLRQRRLSFFAGK